MPKSRRHAVLSITFEDWQAWLNAPLNGTRIELPEWPGSRVLRVSENADFQRNRFSLLIEHPSLPEVGFGVVLDPIDLEATIEVGPDGGACLRFTRVASKMGGNGGEHGRAAD